MLKINVTDRDGKTHEIEDDAGLKVMEVLRDNDMGVAAICGGGMACATCHVYVDEDWLARLPEQSNDELDLIRDLETFQKNSRLSCQIPFTEELDGLVLTVAPEE